MPANVVNGIGKLILTVRNVIFLENAKHLK